jgi:hypothetical protein
MSTTLLSDINFTYTAKNSYLIPKGYILMAKWVDGVVGTYYDIGNCTALTVEPVEKSLEHRSAKYAQKEYDQIVSLQTGCNINFSLDEMAVLNLKMFLNATDSNAGIIYGNTGVYQNYAIKFIPTNTTGPMNYYEFHKVKLAPSGPLSLIGNEHVVMSFSGKTIADNTNHPTSPFFSMISGLHEINYLGIIKNNYAGDGPPTASDDKMEDYSVQSRWIDITAYPYKFYFCTDDSEGAAVWVEINCTMDDLAILYGQNMIAQNANNVAITGGSINGTIIGGLTPVTGTFTALAGNSSIITDSSSGNITAAQMKGQTHVVTGAYTLSLPTAVVGYHAVFIASTAAIFSIDVASGTDVLVLNGESLTAGNGVISDGSIYAECYVECRITGKYTLMGIRGLFIDAGK